MGFFSSIGSFFSGVASKVGSFISSVGGSLGTVCKALSPYISVVLKSLGTIIDNLSKVFGLVNEKENIEEFGLKAEYSNKKPENYDSYSAYINDVEKVELTPEQKLKLNNPEEKAKARVIGTAILIEGLSEKVGVDLPIGFWVGLAKSGLSVVEIKSVLDIVSKIQKAPDLERYLNNNLEVGDMKLADSVLEKGIKNLNENISDKELDTKFEQMKSNYEKFDEKENLDI